MIITTAGRTNEEMTKQAKNIANELNGRFIERNKRSVWTIQQMERDDCIVVGKERLELYPIGENAPFFFHPNSATFRIKRLIKGEHDPFIEAACLQVGKTLLDCTLGLASDSIVASYVVGNDGKVTGIEGNPYLAYMVKKGLQTWESGISEMNQAMKQIQVNNDLSLSYLKSLANNSYDCVYFDPMFEEHILESDGIKALSRFAIYKEITQELINEAIRVAKERVVLKDHFRSTRFEEFHFDVYKRKTSKFHFGVIEK
ncbi:class I SAM-dependent methyltransferase [Bacillus sp. FJAT-29790]|uniref:class I SAM-dependent methyltransferase n=1 Tax=Bacillus sp. FJAT-29790 TaxID=1895002 RepID=UPI001C250DF2|nr:class I SAM-dependent methyltransferase [Bacillus sp. FJAT-29790]MBU8878962.1 class I SAM-dependent methyltransferase [Bacillus sp. FJAT-29790]